MSRVQSLIFGGVLVVVALLAALPASGAAFVELSRPQSDDRGHYVATTVQTTMSVMGFVAVRPDLQEVVVNGIPAEIYQADYRVWGAPSGWPTWGFRIPLLLDPGQPIYLVVTSADGQSESFVYNADTQACLARLKAMQLQYTNDNWWYLRLGNAYTCTGQFDYAYPFFNIFIEREPSLFFGPFFLGICFFDDDDFYDADRWFDRAERINRNCFACHLERGELYQRRRDFDRADREFNEASRLRPHAAEPRLRLGESAFDRGDYSHASEQFNEAVKMSPRLGLAHYDLGNALAAEGKNAEAQRAFGQAIATNPRFSNAHFQMGRVLQQQGKITDAAQQYRSALQARPDNAPAHLGLGQVLEQQGNKTEALHQYREAVRSNPGYGEAHQALSKGEFQRGNYPEAWNQAHAAQQYGAQPEPKYLEQLRQKMPEPKWQPQSMPNTTPRTQPQPRMFPMPSTQGGPSGGGGRGGGNIGRGGGGRDGRR